VKLYIVGVGRSGTSLLQSMLAANRNISALPETAFLRRFVFGNLTAETLEYDSMANRYEKFTMFKEHCKKEWLELYIKELSGDFFSLEKDPRLIEYIDCIVDKIPESKVIHIYRDPRDVLLSKKKAEWSKGRSLLSYLVAGAAQLKLLRLNLASVEHVKYEELINNPEVQLKNLCHKLELDFDKSMLDHRESASKLTHEDEKSWKIETYQPVIKNNFNKWKKIINGTELAAVYFSNQWIFSYGGYESELGGIKKIDLIKGYLLGNIAKGIAAIYVIVHRLKKVGE